MALISQAPDGRLTDDDGVALPGYKAFLSAAAAILQAMTLSGTTANRPTKFLWVGRPYFDTGLGANGKPIWIARVSAAGVATWVDATSAVV